MVNNTSVYNGENTGYCVCVCASEDYKTWPRNNRRIREYDVYLHIIKIYYNKRILEHCYSIFIHL